MRRAACIALLVLACTVAAVPAAAARAGTDLSKMAKSCHLAGTSPTRTRCCRCIPKAKTVFRVTPTSTRCASSKLNIHIFVGNERTQGHSRGCYESKYAASWNCHPDQWAELEHPSDPSLTARVTAPYDSELRQISWSDRDVGFAVAYSCPAVAGQQQETEPPLRLARCAADRAICAAFPFQRMVLLTRAPEFRLMVR